MSSEKVTSVFARRKSIDMLYETSDGEVHLDYQSAYSWTKRRGLKNTSILPHRRGEKPEKPKKTAEPVSKTKSEKSNK